MKIEINSKARIYRTIAAVVGVGLIAFGCLVILKPFLPAILLAAILCLSTWPAFVRLEKKLSGRTGLAAGLMTTAIAVCFLIPIAFLGTSLAESFGRLMSEITHALEGDVLITTPVWVSNIPFAGDYLDQLWQERAYDKEHLVATVREFAGPATHWLIVAGSGIGHGVLDVALGVLIAFFFFHKGQAAVVRLRTLIENFGGPGSLHLLQVSANTVIGVVYGILGTAIVLGALAAVGFWIADVPGAPFLGVITFLLAIIPGAPPLILIPVTLWLFMEGQTGMGIFMALWSVAIIVLLDLIIRPYLISLGSKMPLLLVFLGVFGGVAAFGFIGLFIGPALLAIAAALITELSHKRLEPASGGSFEL